MVLPKVSIIILNWNGLNDTLDCLESLNKITYKNFNIILVDNGSIRNEAKIIQNKYPSIKVIRNNSNEGFCKGNNTAAKLVLEDNVDYLLFLNNDTTVEPNFLTEMIKYVESNKEVGIAGPLILNYYQRNKVYSSGGKLNTTLFNCKEFKTFPKKVNHNINFISGCAFLIKRNVIEKIGLWDEDYFGYWEETDYCLRAIKKGYTIACVPQSIIYHKVAKTNKYLSSRYIYYIVRNNLLITKKHAKWYQWPFILMNFFIRRWIGYFFKLILTKNYSSMSSILLGTRDFFLGIYGKGSIE
ncbi:MAG: glycosyltransferase family 2 protein [Candidatus Helarchaeota archaeon]